ncbi:MAG: BamA/TamA family outer membrane protein [Selenomonadaceae bacterium]|nr:BamA/TamA family outer membrane protein [Selenomonadaceae bacterium]
MPYELPADGEEAVDDGTENEDSSLKQTEGSEDGEEKKEGQEGTESEDKKESTESPATESVSDETDDGSAVMKYLKQFNGKTVVDIVYEGASSLTLPTIQIIATQHVGDDFSASVMNKDMEAFVNTGYFYDAYPKIEEVPEGVVVTYHLLENPIYKGVVFVGNTIEKTEELERYITLQPNDVLNNRTLHDNITAIQERYRGTGYILMKITDIDMNKDTGILTLKINEGIIEGYKVKGNKKTKDKVILREMRQKPGEVFNADKARRSIQRVNNLGFFEEVSVKWNPGVEPNAIVMEIDVKEKRTGTFGIGAGYSSEDGIIGMVSVSDTNLRGTGDAVSIMYEMSGDDEDAHGIAFSYRRPWLDDKETAGTFRFYNRTYEYDDYDVRGRLKEEYMRKYTGGEITLGRPVSEWSTNYVTLRHRKDEYVKHVSSGNAGDRSGDAGARWRSNNFGITRSVTLEHVTDTRDNIYNPTEGGKVNLSGEFGGVWGGDFTFQKYSIDHQQFFKAGHAQVWALRTKGGIGFGDISEFNQYRIGGQDTLRGYREAQFRGERMILGTLEYRFPLISKVQGALFTDWGSAWSTGFEPEEFHGSGGFGIAVNTPLGPLRLDYGRGTQGGRLHFSVGGTF